MKKNKFFVIGLILNGDCEADTQLCDSYKEALEIKREWESQEKYAKVFLDRMYNENPS